MLVRMSLMKDKELYKRDWEIEGLVNFIGKHGLCRLRGRALKWNHGGLRRSVLVNILRSSPVEPMGL